MAGINAVTGELITGVDELRQRINRLFSTRKGGLPLRRSYGCNLPDLVDRKMTQEWQIDLFAETAAALADPDNGLVDEVKLQRTWLITTADGIAAGSVELALDLILLISGEQIRMEGVTIA